MRVHELIKKLQEFCPESFIQIETRKKNSRGIIDVRRAQSGIVLIETMPKEIWAGQYSE